MLFKLDTMLIRLFEENPNPRHLEQINECLKDGGVIIYPTDTLYGFACSIQNPKAIERIARLKQIDLIQNTFSIIFNDLSLLSDYAKPIDNAHFKLMKRCLPGAFTFILEANNNIPKQLMRKKKQVGIRIPDHLIARQLVENLGNPLLSSSLPVPNTDTEYATDPELIYELFGNQVDIVIDAGFGQTSPSTIVDLTDVEPVILREGLGDISLIY